MCGFSSRRERLAKVKTGWPRRARGRDRRERGRERARANTLDRLHVQALAIEFAAPAGEIFAPISRQFGPDESLATLGATLSPNCRINLIAIRLRPNEWSFIALSWKLMAAWPDWGAEAARRIRAGRKNT